MNCLSTLLNVSRRWVGKVFFTNITYLFKPFRAGKKIVKIILILKMIKLDRLFFRLSVLRKGHRRNFHLCNIFWVKVGYTYRELALPRKTIRGIVVGSCSRKNDAATSRGIVIGSSSSKNDAATNLLLKACC